MRIAEDEQLIICFNPDAAERTTAIRARMITQLEDAIADSDQLSKDKRAEFRGVISTKPPGLNRYLRVTPGGLLRTDAAKATAEENLDDKYLLRTPDPKMTTEAPPPRYTPSHQTTAHSRTSTCGFTDYATTSAAEPGRGGGS